MRVQTVLYSLKYVSYTVPTHYNTPDVTLYTLHITHYTVHLQTGKTTHYNEPCPDCCVQDIVNFISSLAN